MPKRLLPLVCAASVLWLAAAAPSDAAGGYEVPTVSGPLAGNSPSNHPFDGASYQYRPIDLARYGYVEQEYFVSGTANVYQYATTAAATDKVDVIGSGPYTNRILVHRPSNPSKFSGNVIVEVMNATNDFDIPIMWSYDHAFFMSQGDVWVGITSKPVDIVALKKFNPTRYAALGWPNPLNENSSNCPVLQTVVNGASYATQDGLLWDVVSQTAALLRSSGTSNPLYGFNVRALYLTGYSQSAFDLLSYVNAITPTIAGKPYDGYLIASGFGMQAPLNECSPAPAPGDPRNIPHSANAAIVQTQSQSEYAAARTAYRRDGDSPTDRFRYYEEAGPSHVVVEQIVSLPDDRDTHAAGGATLMETYQTCNPLKLPMSDFPAHQLLDDAFAKLYGWVLAGVAPPHARLLTGGVDSNGNATGGVRSPNVDDPFATYTMGNAGTGAGGLCFLYGSQKPIPEAKLRVMYPTHATYVSKVTSDAQRIVNQGFITTQDALQAIRAAEQSNVP